MSDDDNEKSRAGTKRTLMLGHEISQSQANWPKLTNELLEQLQLWAAEKSLPRIPSEQLAIFLHSCYYNKAATLRCMDVYYRMRATVPDFFANRDPLSNSMKYTLNVANYINLPRPDKDGNQIIFHGLRDTNSSHYIFSDSVKLLLMTIDASLYNVGRTNGHIFLFDMAGVKITHLTRLSLTGIRKFFEYIQEGMPVRLKAIHVLNCVWFIDKVLALLKPFMKKELLDILHLHSENVCEVYQYIPPECLPKDFGGDLCDVKTLHEQNCQKLVSLRDYFLKEEQLYRGYQNTPGRSSTTENFTTEKSQHKDTDHGT